MRLLTASIFIALAIVSAFGQDPAQTSAQSQKQAASPEVNLELTQTANAYRAGDFAAAQRHAERAVELDPANLTAATFLARVRHQRYQPGNDTEENLDRARAAIAAYQKLLALDSQSEEAYKAIAVLYAATHQDQLLRAWILQRATNAQLSNEKRALAYAILAGKDWDCSYRITELPDNKFAEKKGGIGVVVFRRPKDAGQLETMRQCIATGLEMADAALLLDGNSESAWAYKTNLLLESAKLAEMEGMDLLKADREREAKAAGEQAAKLAAERRKKEEQGQPEPNGLELLPRPLPPPPTPKKPINHSEDPNR